MSSTFINNNAIKTLVADSDIPLALIILSRSYPMTSTDIYTSIAPTYLYIKQHSITGKKYFGKTISDNPHKYQGSGTVWLRHIKKHGKEFVKTIWVSDVYTDTSIIEIALHFSKENNIVESDDWANLMLENGLDGTPPGIIFSDTHKTNMSNAKKGVKQSREHLLKNYGRKNWKITSPTGEVFMVELINEFCTEHGLSRRGAKRSAVTKQPPTKGKSAGWLFESISVTH